MLQKACSHHTKYSYTQTVLKQGHKRNNSSDIHYRKYCIIGDTNPTLPDCKPTRPNQETPKHYIIEIKVFAIANTTRRPDRNTPKQETHGALVVVLAVRGDAAHN